MILPGLFQGSAEDDDVSGYPSPDPHYAVPAGRPGTAFPFDIVVTLYGDAQAAKLRDLISDSDTAS